MQENVIRKGNTFAVDIAVGACKHRIRSRAQAESKDTRPLVSTNAILETETAQRTTRQLESMQPTRQLRVAMERGVSGSTKLCQRCKEEKPVEKFARHGRSKDGRARFCRMCTYREGLEHPVDEPNVEYRTCRECGEVKHVKDFTKNMASPTGVDCKCRACNLKKTRENHQRYRTLIERAGGEPLVASKKCTLCGTEKPAAAFYRAYSTRAGLSSRCRECTRAVGRGVSPKAIRQGLAPPSSKTCSECQQRLPMRQFRPDAGSDDGRTAACRKCINAESHKDLSKA